MERLVSAILLAVTVLVLVRPFFLVDWYYNDEVDRYPGRLEVLYQHMRWDNPWPRWIPELAGGHGYPLLNFFNPMSLIFGLPFRAMGLRAEDAMKCAVIVMFTIGAVHMRLLGNRLLGRWLGLLAAVLYLTAPYTLSNFYVRGDLAEAGAMMLFPMVLHHYLAYAESGRRANWIGLAIGYALLVPMHAFSALIFTHAFAVIWALHLVRDLRLSLRSPLRHVKAGLACALGVLCAAFYWVPVFAEMGTVRIEGFFTMETFDNFAIPFYGIWVRNIPLPLGERLLTLGPVLWCLFAVGMWSRRVTGLGARRGLLLTLVGLVIFCSFMSTNVSRPAWDVLFWVQRIVFPWRWLSIGSLAIALLGALAPTRLLGRRHEVRAPLAVAISIMALALTWPDAVLPRPMDLADDHWELATRGEREHVLFDYGEYFPETVIREPQADSRRFVVSGHCSVSGYGESDQLISFRVDAQAPCVVTVTQFLWLPWHGTLDGAETAIDTDHAGRMRFEIPEGAHEVRVAWVPTRAHVAGGWLTVLGLALLALAIAAARAAAARSARAHRAMASAA